MERYRAVGADCRDAMEAAARGVERGMTEADVAANLAAECRRRGVLPGVVLVAADDRLTNWRHPIPKATPVERCAMLVLCGRRQGLVAAITRLVHFGQFGEDLIRRHMAACTVDARMIWATTPGARAADVLQLGRQTYSEFNFPDEWRLHHQGGGIGYRSREYIATPQSAEVVLEQPGVRLEPVRARHQVGGHHAGHGRRAGTADAARRGLADRPHRDGRQGAAPGRYPCETLNRTD